MSFSYKKDILEVVETEVLVIGAGPSGFSAALACARLGVEVTLVERFGFPGGMATAGLVGPFMTSFDAKGERQVIGGVFDELVRRLEQVGGAIHPSKVEAGTSYSGFISKGHSRVTPFDPELMKMVMFEMLEEANVNLVFHTTLIDVEKSNGLILGCVFHNKTGFSVIRAKIVIDCTGDGDAAVLAGSPYVNGRFDGGMQPATLFFRVYNVDSNKVIDYIEAYREKMGRPFYGPFNWLVQQARDDGEWSISRNEIGMYETSTPGVWRINTTRISNIDGTNAADLTRAENEGRKQIRSLLEFLKKNVPGYEDAKLMDTAATIGIRETRHIIGEYIVEKEDVLDCVVFDDAIMIASNSMDIHSDKAGGGEYTTIRGDWYSIPFRALLPLDTTNLMVAGRSISATSDAASAFRVMPCCMAMGEAAGVAAALSVQDNVTLRQLDICQLQKVLGEQGAILS